MRRNRRVKILATLGPVSSNPEMIKALFEAGADMFRINMSHTKHDKLRELHGAIRQIEAETGHHIGVLVDLQGPKLRIGEIAADAGPVTLEQGASFIFDRVNEPGDSRRVHLPHPEIFAAVEEGHNLLIDDGKLRLVVCEKSPERIRATVVVGGRVSSRKGISLPDSLLPMGAMTEKDRKDLDYALSLGVDWVALSFVQREDDVAEAKKIARGRAAIMSKIEKPAALRELDRIIEQSDGIMVARGDLGVELPVQKVPGLQKALTRASRDAGKPVVVATQMLESMITSPVPTRAEVSDVATAVFDGADAVMLSAESAAGEYPVEAVRTLNKVAVEVEGDPLYDSIIHAQRASVDGTAAGALSAAACSVAQDMKLACIVCYTSTGATAYRAARQRPKTPILVLTPSQETARRLAVVWGLHCVYTKDPKSTADMVERAGRKALELGLGGPADKMIIAAGMPFGTPGATNMLRIACISEERPRR